jgi:hypothetical protein
MTRLGNGPDDSFNHAHGIRLEDGAFAEVSGTGASLISQKVDRFSLVAPEGLPPADLESRMSHVRQRLRNQGFVVESDNDGVIVASLRGVMPASREERIRRVRAVAEQQRVSMASVE